MAVVQHFSVVIVCCDFFLSHFKFWNWMTAIWTLERNEGLWDLLQRPLQVLLVRGVQKCTDATNAIFIELRCFCDFLVNFLNGFLCSGMWLSLPPSANYVTWQSRVLDPAPRLVSFGCISFLGHFWSFLESVLDPTPPPTPSGHFLCHFWSLLVTFGHFLVTFCHFSKTSWSWSLLVTCHNLWKVPNGSFSSYRIKTSKRAILAVPVVCERERWLTTRSFLSL